MATLNTKAGSSTTAQRKHLVSAGRRLGHSVDDLRAMAGCGLRQLSKAACSELITSLTGKGLPHPPGEKPPPPKRRSVPGIYRMITQDHVEQITRLLLDYFDTNILAITWLTQNFKVIDPWDLRTAGRAGEVIRALKGMHERRDKKEAV